MPPPDPPWPQPWLDDGGSQPRSRSRSGSGFPPIPPGFELVPATNNPPPAARTGQRRDPWDILREAGFVATNGYRTDADTARIASQGYRPARNSRHLDGGAVDLTHPSLSRNQQGVTIRRLLRAAGYDPGEFRVIEEGHHRHLQVAGWRSAPGTPGTPNSGLPALPPGFEVVQRGALGTDAAPPVGAPAVAGDQGAAAQGREAARASLPAINQPGEITRADPRGMAQAAGVAQLGQTELAGPGERGVTPRQEDLENTIVQAVQGLVNAGASRRRIDGYLAGERRQPLTNEAWQAIERGRRTGHLPQFTISLAAQRGDFPVNEEEALRRRQDEAMGRPEGPRTNELLDNPVGATVLARLDPLGLPALLPGESGENYRRGRNEIAERHPIANLAGEIWGGARLPFPGNTGAANVIPRQALAGGGYAGAYGLNLGEGDFQDRLYQGLTTAPIGAAVPPALHGLLAGGRAVGRGARRLLGDDWAASLRARLPFLGAAPETGLEPSPAAGIDAQPAASRNAIAATGAGAEPPPMRIATMADETPTIEGPVNGAQRSVLETEPYGTPGIVQQQPRPGRYDHYYTPEQEAAEARGEPIPPGPYQRGDGSPGVALPELWRLTPDDLDGLLASARQSEQDKLVAALGEDGAREFARLDRARNNTVDIASADRASREFDQRFGDLTPEQERLVYGIGETEASADEIADLIRAHNVVAPTDSVDDAARVAARAIMRLHPGDLSDVIAGRASVSTQADFVRLSRAYQRLAEAGADNIPQRLLRSVVEAGADPDDAADLVGGFLNAFREGPPPGRVEAMTREDHPPELVSDPVEPDAVTPGTVPGLPLAPANAELASAADVAGAIRSIRPEDVQALPPNRILSADEAARANPGTIRTVPRLNPQTVLEVRQFPHPARANETISFRGPVDAETYLRTIGGVRDDGGELAAIGIVNSRPRPEVPQEARLGPLLNRPGGRSLDEAAESLWERGYFPHLDEPATADDLIDLLRASRAGSRTYHPDDLGEVAAYEGAQAQRMAADAAEQEGGALGERVGEPVGIDDLRANEPPLSAYEDRFQNSQVANINLSAIESAEDIAKLLDTVERRLGGFDASRRGTVSHAETETLAADLGLTADDLLRRRHGEALNAEQALAARQLLARSADEVIELARRATGPGASEASRAAFGEALLRHSAIQEQVAGAIAETGRALSSLRIAAKSRAVSGRIHQAVVEGMGGEGRLEDIAQGIIDLQRQGADLGGVNRFSRAAIKPRFRDKLVELWYNSILSGPQTHATNVLSNMMTAALQLPEQVAAAAIGQGRRAVRAVRGQDDDFDRVMMSEIGPRTLGLMQGGRDGLRAFRHTLRTGEVPDFVTKVEQRTQRAIGGVKGEVLRFPTRLLAAEDELFKSVAQRMELSGLAARRAKSESLRGEEYRNRVADLIANPPDDMLARSLDYSRYLTFQTPLGKVGQRVMATTNEHPWLKLFLPFVRTPTNILKFAAERSPLGLLLRDVRANLRAGGERRHLALARIGLGTGLGMITTQLAQRGIITGGGPADREALDLMRAQGWQPYSIKVGDTYYSYARLDPLASTLGIAADLVDQGSHMSEGQRQRQTSLLIASTLRNLGNKTWLSGMSDMIEAIEDPERNLDSLISRLAGSIAVPALVSQTARAFDPTERDTSRPVGGGEGLPSYLRRPLAAIQSRIPFLSRQLPARRDAWGRESVGEGSLGPDILSPIRMRTARTDPVSQELLGLGSGVGRPSRRVRGRELTQEEYGRYSELSGRYLQEDLAEAMAAPDWGRMTPEERLAEVGRIKRTARADAVADLGLDAPPLPPGFVVQER